MRSKLTKPLVEIAHATVEIDGSIILRDLDLEIARGQHVVILGANGAGKTTLLRLLGRELYPVRGDATRVRLLGRERWNVFDLRKQLGIVSHDLQNRHQRRLPVLDAVLSGYFASVGLHRHQRLPARHRSRAQEVLQQLGLEALADRTFDTLSSGEQRRVLLARALVHDPHTLLLDEPTANLDLAGAFRLIEHLRRWLTTEGGTLIVVSHRLREILPEIERVVLMRAGEIVFDGPKREALRSERISDLYSTAVRVLEEDGYFRAIPASK